MKDAKYICKNKMQEWKRGKTFAGSPIRSTKKKMKPCFVRGANASQTDRASRLHQLFWPLCFDCLCCMHKIFMLWKICSNKNGGVALSPPPELFAMCVQLFTLKWNYEGKKKGKLCYLNVALSLAAPILPRFYRFLHFINHFAMAQWTLNCRLPQGERRR